MKEQIILIAKQVVEHNGFFVAVVKMVTNHKIQILVDGEQSVSLDLCSEWHRAIREQMEQDIVAYKDGNFELEVSSFGIGEVLVDVRQYSINIGRKIKVNYLDETGATQQIAGKLVDANSSNISVEQKVGKGKKAILEIKNICVKNIKKAIIEIDF